MAAPSLSQRSPIATKQVATDIGGHHTEVVTMTFEDHLFIVVTQYMKLGTIVQVTRDLISDEVQGNVPLFSTKVLLGKDEPLTHVIAKTIVTELNPSMAVLLTLALKETKPHIVQELTALIKTCL